MGVSLNVAPASMVNEPVLSVIRVGEAGSDTVTVNVAVTRLLLFEVAVMVARPPFTPDTTPESFTVATFLSLVDHLTSALVRAGLGVTAS